MNQFDNSESFSLQVKYPIQCFTLNNEGNKVIVANKTQCELYSIEQREFSFKSRYQLRASHNLCIMDISWNKLDPSLVVSGGSNGELYKFNITPTEIMLDSNFTNFNRFHDRTINKINFHPNEANILLSGGQDGIIKLIDFRSPADNITFKHDAEDKVTDVQFNPSFSMKNQFASGSDLGFAFTWDTRFPLRYERKINIHNPHLGGVHLDWHPDQQYKLATASRDKQICVYDLSFPLTERLTPVNTLTHSESVTSIKWRPKRPNQITACSTGFDAHLYVWDLMRPYVPYASFDQLTNKVQNFVWRNSPKVIIASTKERLFNMNISEAIRPADCSSLVTIQMDKHGSVIFAVGVGDSKKIPGALTDPIISSSITNSTNTVNNSLISQTATPNLQIESRTFQNESISHSVQHGSYGSISVNMTTLFNKPTNIDSQSNESDHNVEKFRITKSVLYFDDQLKQPRSDWFCYAATNYKFKEKSFEDLCDHNGQVALVYKKFNIFKDWMILKTIYKESKRLENFKEYQNLNNSLSLPLTSNNNIMMAKSNQADGSDSNLSNLNVMTTGFQHQTGNVANTLINIHNPSSSSSNSSSGTSSSSNQRVNVNQELFRNINSSRIRNFSENSNDEILMGGVGNVGIISNDLGATTTTKNTIVNNNFETSGHPNFNHSITTNIHNNTLDINQNDDESYYFNNNLIDKFVEEDEMFALPSDIIEYNDDLSEDYFINDINKSAKLLNSELEMNTTATNLTANSSKQINKNLNETNFRNQLDLATLKLNTLPLAKQRAYTDFDLLNEKNKDGGLLLQPVSDLKSSEIIENKESSFLKNLPANVYGHNLNEAMKTDFNNYFQQLLISYVNEENDLPTAVFMFLVATLNDKFDRKKLENTNEQFVRMVDEWFVQYIDLLQVFEFWNLRIEIIKNCQSDLIKTLTQNSINYNVMCSECKKTIKSGQFICLKCNHNIYLCSFCHLPVKRLYAWCNLCCHGGHLNHIMKWFKTNSKCPTGCGCKCRIF